MKNKFIWLLLLIIILISCTFFIGCGKEVSFKLDFIVDGEVYSTINTRGNTTISMPRNPKKDGYLFEGWYWDEDTWDEPFTANSLLNQPLSSDMRVYAKFKKIEGQSDEPEDNPLQQETAITINYYVDGNLYNTATYYNNQIILPSNPTKDKYEFDGWFLDENGRELFDITTIDVSIDVEINVYAQFTKLGDIKLSVNSNIDEAGIINGAGYYNNNDIAQLSVTINKGYRFLGWYYGDVKLSSQTNYLYNLSNQDVDLIARFEILDYSLEVISQDSNVGLVAMSDNSQTTDFASKVQNTIKYKETVKLIANTLDVYNFLGWYDSNNKLLSASPIYEMIMTNEDVTIKGKWELKNYNLTYVLNDGANAECNPTTFTIEDNILLENAAKDYADFNGWYLDDVFNEAYVSTKDQNKNITLYAKFDDWFIINGTSFEGVTDYYKANYSTLDIPNNVTAIANSAFSNCSRLESITIPNGVTSIGAGAFSDCSSLTSIEIPDSVAYIGEKLFSGCTSLAHISIDSNNAKYDSRNSCNAIIETEMNKIVAGCKNTTIPNTITSISENAFSNCSSLTSIIIPDSVTSIGKGAFFGCNSLESITLPFVGGSSTSTSASQSTLFGYIFGSNSYDGGVSIEQYYRYIYYSYSTYSYSTYYIPSSLKKVILTGDKVLEGAFSGCSSLTSITIPDNVTSIGSSAFSGCIGLTSIIIPDSVTSIGAGAFSSCSSLTKVNISNLNAWYNIVFYSDTSNPLNYAHHLYLNDEEITELVIPNSITEIKEYAFFGCSSLTSITIPDNVTSIGSSAFSGCIGLTSIIIPDSVTSIGAGAFSDCSSLTSIDIPSKVTSIRSSAFLGCTGLTSITIPNSVKSIEEGAFSGCSSLTKMTLPFIGDKAHASNDAYQYPIGYIFGLNRYDGGVAVRQTYNGEIITSYTDGSTRLSTADTTYYIPKSLKEVIITGSSYIPRGAFSGCSSLTSITIPDNVTNIGHSAFNGCSGLTSIEIPSGVTNIGSYAFCDSGLKDVTYKGTIEQYQAITKNAYYKLDVSSTCVVHCIDGDTTF